MISRRTVVSFRTPIAILSAIFLLLLSGSAQAQDPTPQQYANLCYQPQSDVELKISYCTKAIDSGQLSAIALSAAYVNRGLGFVTKDNLEHAMSDYDSAIEANPVNAEAFVVRGNLFRKNGEESKALADYDRAIAIPVRPANASETLDRARAYMYKGDFDAALIDLNEVNRLNPKIREVYLSRANIYHKRRDYKAAIAEYDAQLKLNPKDAPSLDLRALTYIDAADFEHALADSDAAINLNQFVAKYYDTRALAQRVLGNQDAASRT
jgi:tetratricopeptide (TPR) repeat protein